MADTRWTKRQTGAMLAYGWAEWTENEDSAEDTELRGFALLPGEKCVLSLRNGSPTVDITAYYGNWRPETGVTSTVACTMNDTANTVTSAAHGLKVGQKIYFTTTTGGVNIGEGNFYYIVAVSDADTFQFSTAIEGAAFNITADGSNFYYLGAQLFVMGSVALGKWVAGTTTSPVLGKEEVVLEGVAAPFVVFFVKSAVTAAAFNVYAELRKA